MEQVLERPIAGSQELSRMGAAVMLATSPLLGLLFVMTLPMIGIGMLFYLPIRHFANRGK